MTTSFPWTLGASAFNWTPDVIRAESRATDIAVSIVSSGIAPVIEVELGQLWRSFPHSTDAEAENLRNDLAAAGGRVSIVGGSIDDWASPTRRLDDEERISFLRPQLRTAQRLGAMGIRLPIGQAGPALLARLLPELHELDLVLFEEVQGSQHPASVAHRADYETIAHLDDPRLRLLIDISMLMPALPVTYLEQLRASALPSAFVDRLEEDWRDPATTDAAVALLRSGSVPPSVHTLFMNLVVRFGRTPVSDLHDVLPFVGAAHLKFWDLDDADARISQPIRDVADALRGVGFSRPLTSEWGGHEWLDADPTATTRHHLEMVRVALSE